MPDAPLTPDKRTLEIDPDLVEAPPRAPFVELGLVSCFSFLRGASDAVDLVMTARALGYDAIGIADANSFAGIVRVHTESTTLKLRPVIGARIETVEGLTFLAYPKDRAAYGRLCQLISAGRMSTLTGEWQEKGVCEISLAMLADPVTTDHISPAGAIKDTSPAGQYLLANGVEKASFNSYGARRGNDRVMTRGTFANVRIKNLMCPGIEGGYTQYFGVEEVPAPDTTIEAFEGATPTFIYDACMAYQDAGIPLVVIGGEQYGAGSSRDWAAKGTALLGVKAVIAESFERIHRSNLVGMGVIPFEFTGGDTRKTLGLKGDETVSIAGLDTIQPLQEVPCTITMADGTVKEITLKCRIDTAIEIEYIEHGGVLHYVLRNLAQAA